MEAPMSRLETVQRKYTELLAEMKRTEREHIKSKKRADQLQKEKDNTRSELSKMTSQKERLEKLCREMQKDNKKLKDENRKISDHETKMREELHERLEGMVADVQEVVDQRESPENIPANLESDELFRHKFKSFIDQYELREIQFHSLLRTKELEVQVQMARSEQQRKAQEQEANKTRQLTAQVATFSQTETELRSQLNIYVEKFKQVCSLFPVLPQDTYSRAYTCLQLYQVEDTLNNSNELFLTFRREMEEMSKKTKRLEKENINLTRKHEATATNILQMAEERQKTAKELELLRKKNASLEQLCRAMQNQGRGAMQGKLTQQQQQAAQSQPPQQRQASSTASLPNGQAVPPHSESSGVESEYLSEEYADDEEFDENDECYHEDDTEEEDPAMIDARHIANADAAIQRLTGRKGTVPEGAAEAYAKGMMPLPQRTKPVYGPEPPPSGKGGGVGDKEKQKQAVVNGH